MAKILGFGGIFFRSKNQKELLQWYKEILEINIEDWGGAVLPVKTMSKNSFQNFSIFTNETDYFPADKSFMINWMVDDLDAFLAMLRSKNIEILGREDSEFGKFAWILDPDGNKLKLWEP